jgi:hypothetical protein
MPAYPKKMSMPVMVSMLYLLNEQNVTNLTIFTLRAQGLLVMEDA